VGEVVGRRPMVLEASREHDMRWDQGVRAMRRADGGLLQFEASSKFRCMEDSHEDLSLSNFSCPFLLSVIEYEDGII